MASSNTTQFTDNSAEKPATELITSWADAYNRGNTLLYFPREIRDQIFDLAITTDRKYRYCCIEHDREALDCPGICLTSKQMRNESMPIFIRNSTISLEYYDPDMEAYGDSALHPGEPIHVRGLSLGDVEFGVLDQDCRQPLMMSTGLKHLTWFFVDYEMCLHVAHHFRDVKDLVIKQNLEWFLHFNSLKTIHFRAQWKHADMYGPFTHESMFEDIYGPLTLGTFARWIKEEYAKKGQDIEVTIEAEDEVVNF